MKLHNPDHLTDDQIALIPGLRLLDEDEIIEGPHLTKILKWKETTGSWSDEGWVGADLFATYATTLTRAELRAARGLPPEEDCPHDENDKGYCLECGKDLTGNSDGTGAFNMRMRLDARAREVIADAPRADPLAPEPALSDKDTFDLVESIRRKGWDVSITAEYNSKTWDASAWNMTRAINGTQLGVGESIPIAVRNLHLQILSVEKPSAESAGVNAIMTGSGGGVSPPAQSFTAAPEPAAESPTPRTDAVSIGHHCKPVELARALETELAAAQSEIERLKAELDKAKDDFLLAVGNAGPCGACAEQIACGSSMHDHDDECHITKFRVEIERLTKERDAFVQLGYKLTPGVDGTHGAYVRLELCGKERNELRARVATLEGAVEKATTKLNEWCTARNPHPGSIEDALSALAPHRRAEA